MSGELHEGAVRARLEGAEAYLRQLYGHDPALTMGWLQWVTEALRATLDAAAGETSQ